MADLPAELTYLTVSGKLTRAGLDSVDAGILPDAVPAQGQLTFKPEIGPRLSNGALLSGGRVTVPTATPPLTVVVDPVPIALAADGTFSVALVDPKNPLITPNGWSWTVEFDLVGSDLPNFAFDSPVGSQTLDLSSVTPVVISTGSAVVIGPVGPPGPTGATGPAGTAMTDAQLATAVGTGTTKTTLAATYAPVKGSTSVVRKDLATGFWPTAYAADGTPSYTAGSTSTGVRPTASDDITVIWKGAAPFPPTVASPSTAGVRDNVDLKFEEPA